VRDPNGPTNSIFIGNIPYDGQEEEIKELFNKVGDVTSVRLVCDKDTKQPKGYAFCDFIDSASVETAISQMNNVEYRGRRLRVDYAERELNMPMPAKEAKPPPLPPPSQGKDPLPPVPIVQTVADRLAQAKEMEADAQARQVALEAAERRQIAQLMESMSPVQLFTLLGEMQKLALREPGVARALISENSQLCLALQHAQFLVGMVEQPALETDVEVKERAKTVRDAVFNQMLQPKAEQQLGAVKMEIGQPAFPGAVVPPAPFGMPMPAPPGRMGPAGLSAQEQELLSQVSQLQPAQIDALPHAVKEKLMVLLDKVDGA